MNVDTVEAVVMLSFQSMSVPRLAERLTEMGLRTLEGYAYQGRRGTYRLISAVYEYLERAGRNEEAHRVARAFIRPGGGYAYEI